ncbi:carbohydrate esterase family 4 protein [Mucor lusitanicus]|nr:carbohydrate esterase family 4 protein [Mucor lusitanicus]
MQISFIGAALLATAGQLVLAMPAPQTANITVPSTDSETANITLPTHTQNDWAPQFSPVFSNLNVSKDALTKYNDGPLDVNSTLSRETLDLSSYPDAWEKPDPKHPEVQAIIKQINWDLVPKYKVRKVKNYDLIFDGYDEDADPDCWWSANMCTEPKVKYLPPDLYACPTKGDWGLSYDDGPFNLLDEDDDDAKTENPYAEPRLYNFLAKEDLKATLFYIGSNVMTYPAAARRALSDGHTLCSHTWSHPPMTTQTNEQAVAELYWTLKAIKEATGVTVKCWRPPQGDVDDRIRAIAHQMGMRTVLWNRDTNDWDMPAPGGGKLSPATVDGYFRTWIKEEEQGKNKEGVLVLEHELNHATVNMTEAWLPTVKKTFNVVSAMTCNNVLQPYWETDFKYPAIHNGSTSN